MILESGSEGNPDGEAKGLSVIIAVLGQREGQIELQRDGAEVVFDENSHSEADVEIRAVSPVSLAGPGDLTWAEADHSRQRTDVEFG